MIAKPAKLIPRTVRMTPEDWQRCLCSMANDSKEYRSMQEWLLEAAIEKAKRQELAYLTAGLAVGATSNDTPIPAQ
jgi:hypothetical protein